MAGTNLGRMGRFGTEPINASGGKVPYGPRIPYTTPDFNARTSATRAREGNITTNSGGQNRNRRRGR